MVLSFFIVRINHFTISQPFCDPGPSDCPGEVGAAEEGSKADADPGEGTSCHVARTTVLDVSFSDDEDDMGKVGFLHTKILIESFVMMLY